MPLINALRNALRAWLRHRDVTYAVGGGALNLPVTIVLVAILSGCSAAAVGSIGAVLSRDTQTGAVHVREAPPGLSAANAGILPGDRLKMVDGVLVDELTGPQVQALLRGPVGSSVGLTFIRGDEVLHIELSRRVLGALPALPPREERIE